MKNKAKLLALNLAILMLLLAVLPIPAAAGAAVQPAAVRSGAGIGTEGDLIAYAEEKTEVMTDTIPGNGVPVEKQFAPTQSGWYEIRLSGQDTVSLAVKDGSGAAVDGIGNAEAGSNGVIRNAHTVSFTAYLQAGAQYQLRCTASLAGSLSVYAETPRTMQLGRLYCLNDNISTVFSLTADYCRAYGCLLSSNSDLMLYREDGRHLASCEDAGSVFLPGNSTYYAICYAGELRFSCGSSLCSWDEGKITLAPTETTEGVFTYTCTVCGATRTEPLAPAPHTHQYTETVIEPTCTEAGYTLYQCLCGSSYTDKTVPALGHSYAIIEAVEPTCTEPGKTAGACCSRCGKVFTAQEEIPALGHSPVTDAAVAPTCTAPGKTAGIHCARCGKVFTAQEEITALGHDIVIDEAVAPTCVDPGKTAGIHCARCGEVLTAQEVLPATGHNYENGVCTDCGGKDPNFNPPTDPTETDPTETDPIETEPVETEPIETEPIATEPVETEPIETEPVETEPIETEPVETEPIETEPIETEPVATEEPCEGYTDIDRSSWYHEAADFVLARGIMSSTKTDSKTFEPYTVCTRSMIATMLYSLEGKPEVEYEAAFPDVKDDQWFTDAVMWAYKNGVVSGYDNGNFGPNDKVTREQMAVILKAYAEKVKGLDTDKIADLSDFADFTKVTWSKPYIRWAVAEGLLSGKAQSGKLYLDPQGNATRAEVAAIMKSFIQNITEAH